MELTLCDLIKPVFNDPSLQSKFAILFYRSSWNQWTYRDVKLSSKMVSSILNKYINKEINQFILLILNVTHTISALIFGTLLSSCAFICVESQSKLDDLIEKLKIQFILTNSEIIDVKLLKKITLQESFHVMGEEVTVWRTEIIGKYNSEFSFAYGITTSGTTGTSKIVKVTHHSIVPNIISLSKILNVAQNDIVYLSSPLTFDPSIIEIFLALSNGASLCIIAREVKLVPDILFKILCGENGPTLIQTTPTLIRSWNSALKTKLFDPSSKLRTLILGGESFPTINEIISWNVYQGISIYNIYGITEISCWATINKVWPSDNLDVSIGEPLAETIITVKNHDMNNIGEMYIGTSTRFCLVNDEQMTDIVKMIPFFRATGDLFKEINKKYYYVGRKDDQIKRWGVSTHLTDIENVVKNLGFLNCVCVCDHNEDEIRIGLFIFSESNIECSSLRRQLRKELLSTSWPDDIYCIKDIPLTSHGKIDKKFLINILRKKNESTSIKDFFTRYWEHFTSTEVASDGGFITSGGDSFSALQFVSALKHYSVPDNFLGFLLKDRSYSECWTEIETHLKTTSSTKRSLNDTHFSGKIEKKLKSSPGSFNVLNNTNSEILYRNLKGRAFPTDFVTSSISMKQICLKIHWKHLLGKCIDASPLVVSLKNGEKIVIIGSHSGRIAVLNVYNGQLISECILQNRVESCACISNCGKYYYVGCYDGRMYKIIVKTGKIIWNFPTGDMIKSTCYLFEDTVIFGSYDKNVYKIDKDGNQKWKREVDGPVLTEVTMQEDLIYVTTLVSTLHVLNISSGEELAKFTLSAPIFSSPIILNDTIVIATVDGIVHWISIESGEEMFKFDSNGQIFSSITPIKEADMNYLLFGSKRNLILLKKRSLYWKIQLDSNIIATPSLISTSSMKYIIAVTCKGFIYMINFNNGNVLKELKLPNEVYSSPAILDNKVIVGCRDDNVYCLTFC